MPTASLPMYCPPELRAATEAWWDGLAKHLRAAGIDGVPDRLAFPAELAPHWHDPALLFSQGCGYPLTHEFRGRWRAVATPCYAAPGCAGPRGRAFIAVRTDSPARGLADLRGTTAAYNSTHSNSGFNLFRAAVAPLARGGRFFGRVVESGGHMRSVALLQAREIDCASIDAVTWALYARHAPQRIAGLRVLAETADTPGLPYITAAATDEVKLAALRAGLFAALSDPSLAPTREALLIAGAQVLADAAYDEITAIERRSAEAGYPHLV